MYEKAGMNITAEPDLQDAFKPALLEITGTSWHL